MSPAVTPEAKRVADGCAAPRWEGRDIDPHRCRESAAQRFDVEQVAAAHERVYRDLIATAHATADLGRSAGD